MTIQETAAAAKAAGKSYGAYVNETEGQAVTVEVPEGLEPAARAEAEAVPEYDEARTCPKCGKTFLVPSRLSRKKYCSVACQQAAAAGRQKEKYREKALARMEAKAEAAGSSAVREAILAKAREIYEGNREGQYGRRERTFEAIAGLWSAWLGREISAADVAAMMALLKIARMGSGHYKEDNYVDAVNYLLFAAELGGE